MRALPTRCSTVTPGKFATFWRRPVRRLKRVDLPEFGGPISATAPLFFPTRGGPDSTATPPPGLQWLIAQSHFGPVHAINGRITGWSATQCQYAALRDKSQVHELTLNLFRQVQR